MSGNTLILNQQLKGRVCSTPYQLIQVDYLQEKSGGRQIRLIGQKRSDFYRKSNRNLDSKPYRFSIYLDI